MLKHVPATRKRRQSPAAVGRRARPLWDRAENISPVNRPATAGAQAPPLSSTTQHAVTLVALISDIHGNAVALEAVLNDLDKRGVRRVVCLGDVAACGPAPEAVIARLRELEYACVLGNTDEWLLGRLLPQPHERDYEALTALIEWGATATSAAARRYLEALRPRCDLDLGGQRLICFHGSPRSSTEPILAETPDHALVEMVTPFPATVYAGGHTHLPLVRRLDGALVINAGSVGVPLAPEAQAPAAPPFAEYAIVSVVDGIVDSQMHRVPVDTRAASNAARASGMPHADRWAAILRRRVTRSNERARAAIAAKGTA